MSMRNEYIFRIPRRRAPRRDAEHELLCRFIRDRDSRYSLAHLRRQPFAQLAAIYKRLRGF
jgi:hypothetical protein